jgi:hypothetical protein
MESINVIQTNNTIFTIAEIIINILKFLDLENDLFKLMYTNKYFYLITTQNELFIEFKNLETTRKKKGIPLTPWAIGYIYRYGYLEAEYKIFLDACCYNYLLVAKYYYDKYTIDIHADNDIAFYKACTNGQTEIVKWLHEKSEEIRSPIDIHAGDDFIFKEICSYGYIKTILLLHDLGKKISLPFHVDTLNEASKNARTNGHADIVDLIDSWITKKMIN